MQGARAIARRHETGVGGTSGGLQRETGGGRLDVAILIEARATMVHRLT